MRSIRPTLLALLVSSCSPSNTPPPTESPPRAAAPVTTATSGGPNERRPFAPSTAQAAGSEPTAAPHDPTSAAPSGRLVLLGSAPAQGAVLLGPRLVIVGPDFDTVGAVDVTTGDEIWRVPLPGQGSGQHILQRLNNRPLLRRRSDLIVFDPTTGAIDTRHQLAMGDRLFLRESGGLCLFNGQCSAQIVSCDDARPLGPVLDAVHVFRHHIELDDQGHGIGPGNSCSGFGVALIGRAGDALVYSGHGLQKPPPPPGAPQRPKFGGTSVLAAVHAVSGKTIWEHEGRGCAFCGGATHGVSPDGRLGWLVRDDTLDVFAPRSGITRYERRFDARVVAALWVEGPAPGLFVMTDKELASFTPGGHQRYRRPLDPNTVSLPRGALLPEHADIALRFDREQLAWLDPRTGKVLETVSISDKVFLTDDGHLLLAERGDRRDATGQVIEGSRTALLHVERKRRPDSGQGPPNQAIVREFDSQAALLRIDADAWSLGEWTDGAERFAALYVRHPDVPDEVRVLRFDPF